MNSIKRIGAILAIFIVGAGGGIFASEILWPSLVEAPLYNGFRLPGEAFKVEQTKKVTVKENEALENVIEETKDSAVAIEGGGTGFILTTDGLIVTLSSIADSTTTVVYQGEELKAGLVRKGETFTSLRVEKDSLPTQGITNPEEVKLGERVFLIGNLRKENIIKAVNHGIVKYVYKDKVHTNIQEPENLEGSPLINIEGNVLGLVAIQGGKVIAHSLPEIDKLID